ncbi:MAG: hypothetical protein U9R19_09880, partial [Bacteroidota bacterium]|nr:hypothetical protein [Bacteroidota bacterium]
SRPSIMNPVPTMINDIDGAVNIVSRYLGRSHIKLGKHEIDNVMEHLTDNPTYLQQTKSQNKFNSMLQKTWKGVKIYSGKFLLICELFHEHL